MWFRYFAISVVWGCWAGHALSHGGGLDSQGGHKERSSGQYHCHKSPCFSKIQRAPDPAQDFHQEAPRFSTLYDRSEWPHWIDQDRDCQDTRAEILIAASEMPVQYKRNQGCNVSHGRWSDPYTGRHFTRAADLDIDHVVPLAWAHGHSGDQWSREVKRRFANDAANLIPVQASINREKGSQGPDDWLPPDQRYQCRYLSQFLGVVRRYGLRLESVEVQRLSIPAKRCRIRL
jgi:hypothetical protein